VMLNHAPDTAERLIMSLTSREAEHHQQPPWFLALTYHRHQQHSTDLNKAYLLS
jgi:hypothetical protein